MGKDEEGVVRRGGRAMSLECCAVGTELRESLEEFERESE